jgi:D-alanyl-D-alanine carboxypeptidase
MKNVPLIVCLLIVVLIFASCSSETLTLEEKLQAVLDENIEDIDGRGVSAAVIMPGKPIWKGVAGISHDTISISPDMLFAIGSITKNVVATLTLKLAEEGKLSLDDSLHSWLPTYTHIDSTITIRQLLNHSSGIYMFWSNQKIWDDLIKDRTKIWTPEEVLSYIKEPYSFAPGEGFRYSNTNYLLMAMIIERVTGSNLSTEFRKRFWQPLGIENTYLSIEEEIPDNLAHVFGDNFNDDGSVLDLTYLPRASHESIGYGSGGLFMTAEDLALWCNALFEGKVLQSQSLDEMLEFREIGFGRQKRGIGLGVERFVKRLSSGETAVGHSGANIGTSAYMVHLPDHHISVVVMINSFNHKCSRATTTDLITTVLKENNVIGIIPYFDFIPWGIMMIAGALFIIIMLALWITKRRKKRSQ